MVTRITQLKNKTICIQNVLVDLHSNAVFLHYFADNTLHGPSNEILRNISCKWDLVQLEN